MSSTVSRIEDRLTAIRRSLDWDVSSCALIDYNLKRICRDLVDVEWAFKDHVKALKNMAKSYDDCEKAIIVLSERIGKEKGSSFGWKVVDKVTDFILYVTNGALSDLEWTKGFAEKPKSISDLFTFKDSGFMVKAFDAGKKEFVDSVKVWDDFDGWSNATKATKASKIAGILGNVITVAQEGYDDFYNKETEEWVFSAGNVKEFIVDMGVEIASDAGAAAIGATVGSFIVPPAGTIVGGLVGYGVDFLISDIEFGNPPQSLKDYTKDFANYLVDFAVDNVGDCVREVGKFMDRVFW